MWRRTTLALIVLLLQQTNEDEARETSPGDDINKISKFAVAVAVAINTKLRVVDASYHITTDSITGFRLRADQAETLSTPGPTEGPGRVGGDGGGV